MGRLELVALGALAQKLAVAANRLSLLAGAALGGLLVVAAHPHLAVQALALHLLLQRAQGLVDIVVANLNLDDRSHSWPDGIGATKPLPSFEGLVG